MGKIFLLLKKLISTYVRYVTKHVEMLDLEYFWEKNIWGSFQTSIFYHVSIINCGHDVFQRCCNTVFDSTVGGFMFLSNSKHVSKPSICKERIIIYFLE